MGKECLIKEYGGDLPVEFATGKVLVDFLKLHEKMLECKILEITEYFYLKLIIYFF